MNRDKLFKISYVLSLIIIISFILVTFTSINGVQASTEGYCVDVHVTDISPSSVEIDDEATVGIQFDNCGENLPEIVNFEIRRFSENIKIKEPLTINFTEPFGYVNSDRFNVYHLYVTRDATPGEYVFEYKLTYGNKDFQIEKEGNFSITVTSHEADLNIALTKTDPTLPKVGEETTLTVRIENFGKGDANSVKVISEHPFKGSNESFIGTLDSGEESLATFTFIPEKSGEFKVPLEISYEDDFGKHTFSQETSITIREKQSYWEFMGKKGELILGGAIVVVLGIFLYFYKKKQE